MRLAIRVVGDQVDVRVDLQDGGLRFSPRRRSNLRLVLAADHRVGHHLAVYAD